MAPTIWVAFLFMFAQPTLSQNISLDSHLYPNRTSWSSPSGHFAFGFYKEGQGFAVGIWLLDGSLHKTVVWTANTDEPLVSANATLALTKNDILVSTVEGSQPKSITGGLDGELIYSASMLENGNFVLYGSDSKTIWQSFDCPTDTILAGQSLILPSVQRLRYSEKVLLSSSVSRTNHTMGRFRLTLNLDAGLSLTPADDDSSSYWAPNSYEEEDYKLNLDDNGHMYLAMENDTISWNVTAGWPSSNHTSAIYRATLDQDGNFRLYSHGMQKNNNSAADFRWQAVDDNCSVYGSCGINSYCMLGEPINCTCVPGFDYINSSETSAGCEMRWGDSGFGSVEEKRMTTTIVSLQNTEFKSDYYSLLQNTEKEDCKEACSIDANCVAAQHYISICYKLKFPLRYGRRQREMLIPYVLFVKSANRDWQEKNIPAPFPRHRS
ncbi:hypothetical protein MRB53_021004 [Persea americana]|uniref:Uncharacterized protein n=1 Tax=Persea americana TaxID=3435 RepID=A0ACC2L2W1_PERAE|nr:hypothetical protein MRB53_021004 [Persea americana]